jgi:AcrR family transcriptional regulator
MRQPAAGTRRYDSSRRREQAATTRRDILDAAEGLFARDGYRSTTMAAIAVRAGVSARTVYVAFATKSGVLRALWNARLRGGDEEVPVAEREWYREVLDEAEPTRRLRLNARNSRAAKVRLGPVLDLVRDAASADDDISTLWDRIQSEYRDNQRAVLEPLHARSALREGLDLDRATDILWTVNHPSLWTLLVGARGWTPEEYEAWCAELACAQLLR